MYKIPILTASFVFSLATMIELIAVEVLRGSVMQWLALPHRFHLIAVMIGINAVQGALFGYAAHRNALHRMMWRQAEQERNEWTRRLHSELQPALSMVQYAAYSTADRQCIEICNAAIRRVVKTVSEDSPVGGRTASPGSLAS